MYGTVEPEFKGPRPQDMTSTLSRRLLAATGPIARSALLQASPVYSNDMAAYHLLPRMTQNRNPRGPYSPSGDELRKLAERVEKMNNA